jgi:GNAT superfamily N-acetyltransferase
VDDTVKPEFLVLSPEDPDPPVVSDRGVALVPAPERRMHAPDCSLLLIDRRSLVARCGCWWRETPHHDGRRLGVIGHYAAADAGASDALLSQACELLASSGAATAVGPMDGNTWRRYRLVVDRGAEPAFFLEPDHPDEWPGHWTRAGFTPLSTYTSALNGDLQFEDPRTAATLDRLREEGISIRTLDPAHAASDLQHVYRLSLVAFRRNFLYTPIAEDEFMAQYQAVLPYVRPELVLLAHREAALVGFMFAVPDVYQARRAGTVDTIILKTIAVDPDVAGMGIGGALMDLVQRRARSLGFRRAIHALIHEANVSRRISDRSARTIRRYALFSKALV